MIFLTQHVDQVVAALLVAAGLALVVYVFK